MFLFDSLPLLVKRRIISYAVDTAQRPTGWHTLLTLSHEFQNLVIPFIFRIIIFHKPHRPYCALSKTLCITKGLKIPLTLLPTVSLARYANATAHAKTLLIDLGHPKNVYPTIERLEKDLEFGNHSWTAVRSIHFFNQSDPHTQIGHTYIINSKGMSTERFLSLNKLARMFLKYMPNVVNLTFNSHYDFTENFCFSSALTRMYLHQLRFWRTTYFIHIASTDFDLNLTHLCVTFSLSLPLVLPKLCPQILRCLEIADLPPNFSWDCFSTSQDGVLCFSNLERLSLKFYILYGSEFSSPTNSNVVALEKQPLSVHFPKLGVLIVKNQKLLAPNLFQNVTLSKALHSINFSNSLHTLHQLSNEINVDSLKRIYLTVNYNVPQDMFYQTTNKYFGRSTPYARSYLDTRKSLFKVKPELINWKSLDTLYIHKIHFFPLTALISQMPLLRYLDIKMVTLFQEDNTFNNYNIRRFISAMSLNCLSNKLKHLIILDILSTFSLSTRVLCFQNLVKRLPALKKFKVSDDCLGSLVHIP